MTPTEQDKELREQVEGFFKNPHCESCHEDWDYDSSYRTDSCCTRFMTDSISKVIELITADRKRVALGARLNEVQNAYEHWINGRSFISSYFRDRIALLSNTKESKDE